MHRLPWLRPLATALTDRDRAVLAVPAAVAFACGLWDLAVPSPWIDELVTMDVAQRPLPQLWALVHHVDAVHGLYYLLIHAVVRMGGVSAFTVRLPSVCAVACAAAGVAALGRRLGGRRLGWSAGLLFALAPTASRYAQEARSYSVVLAVAVFASWTLLRVVEEGGRRPLRYAAAVALLGWLNLMALLLLAAHAITVGLLRPGRRAVLGLSAAAVAAVSATVPLMAAGFRQRGSVGGTVPVGVRTLPAFGGWLLAPGRAFAPAAVAAAVLLAAGIGWRYRRRVPAPVAAVAAPWLAVPPLLLAAAPLHRSYFADRYLLFCLPALALLLGACCTAAPPLPRIALLVALAVPFTLAHLGIRREDSRPWDAAAVAVLLRHDAEPGDAVLFDADPCRLIRSAYPDAFARLRDVAGGGPATSRGLLYGGRVRQTVAVRRLRRLRRVWVVGCRHLSAGGRRLATAAAARQRRLLAAAGPFAVDRRRAVRGLELTLYRRVADRRARQPHPGGTEEGCRAAAGARAGTVQAGARGQARRPLTGRCALPVRPPQDQVRRR